MFGAPQRQTRGLSHVRLLRWCVLVVSVIASPVWAAPSSPEREEVAAALATIVAQWRSQPTDDLLASVRAGDLLDLMEQLALEGASDPLQRRSACLRTQIEMPAVLKKLRDDAVRELHGPPATSVRLTSVEPMLWEQVGDLVQVEVDPTSAALRIVARGIGAASGEEWIITAKGPATRTKRGCDETEAPSPSAAPSEKELVRALATLSKTAGPQAQPRADPTTLTRVVLGVVGATSVAYSNDQQRSQLKRLATRVRDAGGDLVPLLQPEFDAVEQAKCLPRTEAVSDRLSALIIAEMRGDKIRLPEKVGHYVIDRLGEWTPTGHHDFIARGTGPMEGDVWTTERGYGTSKTDFCGTRKAPPIIK